MISLKTENQVNAKNILISSVSVIKKIIYTSNLNLINTFWLPCVLLNYKILLLTNIFICNPPKAPILTYTF